MNTYRFDLPIMNIWSPTLPKFLSDFYDIGKGSELGCNSDTCACISHDPAAPVWHLALNDGLTCETVYPKGFSGWYFFPDPEKTGRWDRQYVTSYNEIKRGDKVLCRFEDSRSLAEWTRVIHIPLHCTLTPYRDDD